MKTKEQRTAKRQTAKTRTKTTKPAIDPRHFAQDNANLYDELKALWTACHLTANDQIYMEVKSDGVACGLLRNGNQWTMSEKLLDQMEEVARDYPFTRLTAWICRHCNCGSIGFRREIDGVHLNWVADKDGGPDIDLSRVNTDDAELMSVAEKVKQFPGNGNGTVN